MDKSAFKKGVKRQEIAPGIIMEKYQEKEKDKTYYFIKIELQLFNTLDFTVDFTGSRNIELEGIQGLVKHTTIEPFTKVVVAKILLEKNWNLKTKFKFSMHLPSMELQQKQMAPVLALLDEEIKKTKSLDRIDALNMTEKDLFNYLQSNKLQFVDHEFLPNNKSISDNLKEVLNRYECIVHWRRAKFILLNAEECTNLRSVPFIFFKGVLPQDVKQGKLSDSWLLSGISIIAENEKLIKRIVLTKEANEYGVYKIKLCKMGSWRTVIIDDFFPCFPLSEPIFSKNNEKELWVLLIEKAFAKMHGNYHCLENGNIKHALIDLTGCPTFTYPIAEKNPDKPFDANEFWDKLKHWSSLNYLIGASTKEIPAENSIAGLVKEHAYCILRLVDHSEEVKVMKIRNPWGVFEWTGDWSKTSPLWTEDLKDKIKPDLELNDGSFWISYRHFLENFETINVSFTKGWQELKLKGKFIKSIDEDNKKIEHFCSRWYYQVDITKKSKVIIGIHQEDERSLGVKQTRPYIDIGLTVVTYSNGVYKLVDFNDTDFVRENFLQIELEPGTYFVVPRSVGVNLCSHDINENPAKNYHVDDFEMKSIMRDIFEKHDILTRGFLTFNELKAFYKFLEKELTQQEYNKLVSEYGRKNINGEYEGIAEKGFLDLFSYIIRTNGKLYVQKALLNLGYTKNLFSYRTRVFRLTFHSDNLINVNTKDALKENIDFVANKLLIRKHGKNIQDKGDNKPTEAEVYGLYYYNR